jgi:hypothetical protein
MFLHDWDRSNYEMDRQCRQLGDEFCIQVRYEALVSNPKKTLTSLTKFLRIKWYDILLTHHEYMNKRIKTAQTEWSTNAISKAINQSSLNSWRGRISYNASFLAQSKMQLAFGYRADVSCSIHLEFAVSCVYE